MQARREWREKFKVTKTKELQLRLHNQARLSFKIEGEIRRSFPDKEKLNKVNTKAILYQIFKGLLKRKEEEEKEKEKRRKK